MSDLDPGEDDELKGMRAIPGGVFTMGSDHFYPEERPMRRARVDSFWIDVAPVTNRLFAAFVAATGYRTTAEIPPSPDAYPGIDPAFAVAGSLVFEPTIGPVPLDDYRHWWHFVHGADWRHPTGSGSSIDGIPDHPVVHVSYADAEAYAAWSGKALPTEAEWEFAARGGIEGADYAWGNELEPGGVVLANYWTGRFPYASSKSENAFRTTPVGTFAANGYGLEDMIGNVWEWTCDRYGPHRPAGPKVCCHADDPRVFAGRKRGHLIKPFGRKVIKGGSHLCSVDYCRRYRPAARQAQETDSSTSHIGFRCVLRRDRES